VGPVALWRCPVDQPVPAPTARSLVLTADESLLDDLLRLAAAAGVEVDVAHDPAAARSRWQAAPLVVVGDDQSHNASTQLGRRQHVIVIGMDDPDVWRRGVGLGAEQVIFLPDSEHWLVERFADAAEGSGRDGLVVAVTGGRGGAGASVLAAGLAVTSARRRLSTMLVDLDPLGGGIDLLLGAEDCSGLRWPDFADTRGRLGAAALHGALPARHGLTVLSWDRGSLSTVPAAAVRAVVTAAARACNVVVLDLPRRGDESTEEALALCTCALLVVPAEVRAVAAAARVAVGLTTMTPDVRVVLRGPSPSGLGAAEVADALGLPVAVEMNSEPRLHERLERGEPPGRNGRGAVADACCQVLDDLLTPEQVWAA
jgi:secretion/DNA translocation related CpaE-like protein